jgi:UDP-glucose 4-epimerase
VHASGTAALLEACIAARVPRLVYVSSAEVYAQVDPSIDAEVDEDHPRAPRSPYGVAKLAAEQVLEICAPAGGVQTTIVRPFSIYGPGAPAGSLIASVIADLDRGRSPAVADPRPVRDYCYVDDAADGIVRGGCRDGAVVRAYNLASGRGTSVAEVVQAVLRAAGRCDLAIQVRGPDRPASALTLRLIGNPARARAELGFEATTALDDGLRRTLHGERPREAVP